MNRPIVAFAFALTFTMMCVVLAAQTTSTFPRSANTAVPPEVASDVQAGAACTIRIVTSRGPIAAQGNSSAGFGWVPCLQVSRYSVAGSSGKSSAAGASTRPSSSSTLTILREADTASSRFRQLAVSGLVIPEVDIRLSHNRGGKFVPYDVYQLTNATVTAVSTGANGGQRPAESVTLAFQQIQRQLLKTGMSGGGRLTALAQAPSTALQAPSPRGISTPGPIALTAKQQTPSGASSQPLLANGNKPATLMAQTSGITQLKVASHGASGSIPTKGPQHSQFDAVTVQRGVTQDSSFTQWKNSPQSPNGRLISQTAPAPSAVLSAAVVGNACAKDPSLRILGVAGSTSTVTFIPGHTYTILGCSFGPDNPNNAVYLSDGSSFTWYLQKTSWSNNSVVVSVSTAPKSAKSNLMLFVLGQNGNTKLNNVMLQ